MQLAVYIYIHTHIYILQIQYEQIIYDTLNIVYAFVHRVNLNNSEFADKDKVFQRM